MSNNRISKFKIPTFLQSILNDIKRHLISLAAPKYRILIKNPRNRILKMNDTFKWNSEFKSKYSRIKVPMVVMKQEEQGIIMVEDSNSSMQATSILRQHPQ